MQLRHRRHVDHDLRRRRGRVKVLGHAARRVAAHQLHRRARVLPLERQQLVQRHGPVPLAPVGRGAKVQRIGRGGGARRGRGRELAHVQGAEQVLHVAHERVRATVAMTAMAAVAVAGPVPALAWAADAAASAATLLLAPFTPTPTRLALLLAAARLALLHLLALRTHRALAATTRLLCRVARERLERLQDGPVARAAAQVAVEVALHLLRGGSRLLLQQAVHGHHPARRAVATLRAVAGRQARLDGVEAGTLRADAFHRGDRRAVARAERVQARVDGAVRHVARHRVRHGHHHRARPAPTLHAPHLGALQVQRVAHVAHQPRVRIRIRHRVLHAVHRQPQRAPVRHRVRLGPS
mmetsp:Transcript_24962/g.80406  ORF Transcript_24962/g.80406 Transcript_24962/m.80406 type:complete len:354 (+) Transcript_24962:3221-4282(+)